MTRRDYARRTRVEACAQQLALAGKRSDSPSLFRATFKKAYVLEPSGRTESKAHGGSLEMIKGMMFVRKYVTACAVFESHRRAISSSPFVREFVKILP